MKAMWTRHCMACKRSQVCPPPPRKPDVAFETRRCAHCHAPQLTHGELINIHDGEVFRYSIINDLIHVWRANWPADVYETFTPEDFYAFQAYLSRFGIYPTAFHTLTS